MLNIQDRSGRIWQMSHESWRRRNLSHDSWGKENNVNRKTIIISFSIFAFGVFTFFIGLILGETRGLSEGLKLAEQRHTEDIGELNKTLMAIQEYYSEHSKYPTSPEQFNSVITFYKLTENGVQLYSGVGSSHFYIITYLDRGHVSIERWKNNR